MCKVPPVASDLVFIEARDAVIQPYDRLADLQVAVANRPELAELRQLVRGTAPGTRFFTGYPYPPHFLGERLGEFLSGAGS